MKSLASIALVLMSAATVAADTPDTDASAAYAKLQAEWDRGESEHARVLDLAETAERRQAASSKAPSRSDFAGRFLKLGETYPGTKAELNALFWAALNAPASESGQRAQWRLLLTNRIERLTPSEFLAAVDSTETRSLQAKNLLAPAALASAKRSLGDPRAAEVLAWVCAAYRGANDEVTPAPFAEAADLIEYRFATSPDVSHFAEALSLNGVPPWGCEYEKHLRTLVERNKTEPTSTTARYALAAVVRAGGVERQAEAATLFRQFVTDHEGARKGSIASSLTSTARNQLARMDRCPLGKPAQGLAGADLDGKTLALADQRGKVVLVVFWASWCAPCLAEVPHERELVEKFKGRPFVVVGVNGDQDKEEALKAVARTRMPWRSVFDGDKKGVRPIAEAWAVSGWPTVFVIDHEGVLRHDDLRGKRLDQPLEALIVKAESAAKSKASRP